MHRKMGRYRDTEVLQILQIFEDLQIYLSVQGPNLKSFKFKAFEFKDSFETSALSWSICSDRMVLVFNRAIR